MTLLPAIRGSVGTPRRVPGRGLITAAVVSTAVLQPLADFNDSHAFNEDWPPHAHFHDLAAVGMLEICSGTALYLLFTGRGDRRLNVTVAALMPLAFWAPFFPAHLVSGSSLDDATAHHPSGRPPKIGGITLYPNGVTSVVEIALLAAGWWRFRRNHPSSSS